MKAWRTIMRTLSGSVILAESATATGIGPIELTDAQLEQVAGGGASIGGLINDQKGSLIPTAGSHNSSGGDITR